MDTCEMRPMADFTTLEKELPLVKRDDEDYKMDNNAANELVNDCTYNWRGHASKLSLHGPKSYFWELYVKLLRRPNHVSSLVVKNTAKTSEWKQNSCENSTPVLSEDAASMTATNAVTSEQLNCSQDYYKKSKDVSSSSKIIVRHISHSGFKQDGVPVKSAEIEQIYSYPSKGRGSLHAIVLFLLGLMTLPVVSASQKATNQQSTSYWNGWCEALFTSIAKHPLFFTIASCPLKFWVYCFFGLILVTALKLWYHKIFQLVERSVEVIKHHFHHRELVQGNSMDHSFDGSTAGDCDTFTSHFNPLSPVQASRPLFKESLVITERPKRREANQFDSDTPSQMLFPDAPKIANISQCLEDPGNISMEKTAADSELTCQTPSSSLHTAVQESVEGRWSATSIVGIGVCGTDVIKTSTSPAPNISILHMFQSVTVTEPHPLFPLSAVPRISQSYTVSIDLPPRSFNALTESAFCICSGSTTANGKDSGMEHLPPHDKRHIIPFDQQAGK